ncbi:hypothetical protein [Paenibacillus pabuli]|uniref:hypothetical protein n=1 Tax=Paenibacillus pabuli TaxID=1472 RepID=UPI003CF8320A
MIEWLPPEGMIGHMDEFNAREGEAFRMTLTYLDTNHSTGKTSEDTDILQVPLFVTAHLTILIPHYI